MWKEMSMFMRIEMGYDDPGRLNLANLRDGLGFDFVRSQTAQHRQCAELADPFAKMCAPGCLQKTSDLARFEHGNSIYQDYMASHAESRTLLRQTNCPVECLPVGHQCR